ncbi:zinc finger MYM-type protein 1 [Brachypodium distachyon]|uniref:zinc finger MYM-type protein 1 n=1 Tax=Brachypodium distachyon TaxID=15368 RepID=UPI00052FE53F|nr:zinc finger MYM-type protein 1 [Brachypodium distachyon]|eukprot:XP_010230059.1 zinc finger MYM-type protein 1 [Brachypodium distachyon]
MKKRSVSSGDRSTGDLRRDLTKKSSAPPIDDGVDETERTIPNPPRNESGPIPPISESTNPATNVSTNSTVDESTHRPKRLRLEFDPNHIIPDPALRIPIEDYANEIRDEVRRAYLLKGRTEANGHVFEQTLDGKVWRSFQRSWLGKYDWLEYSVKENAAFCFYCFLFKKTAQPNTFGNDVFSRDGYSRWKTATAAFKKHVGGPNSVHNIARDCARYLIAQGEAFRGHDESSTSINKGNFKELLEWYKDKNSEVKEAFEKGPGNALMVCSDIQKQLAKCCAQEVTSVIKSEIGDRNFAVLIDEARDSSIKEQMAVIVRFVNNQGKVMESKCISDFFNHVPLIVTQVSASCKRKDTLIAKHQDVLLEKLENGKISSGKGLHQESGLARPGDTRWGSHLKTLLRIYQMWESVVDVLTIVSTDAREHSSVVGAGGLVKKMECYDFVFIPNFLIGLLTITNDLSQALQRKDQDIVEAMGLISDVKTRLQDVRDNGWEPLLDQVKSFCEEYGINVPNMDDLTVPMGESVRSKNKVTLRHYYKVGIFNVAIDATMTEINHRFNEVSSELLVCMSCLNPSNSFAMFNVDKLVRLAEIYEADFTISDRLMLRSQLQIFILNIGRSEKFHGCSDISKLSQLMVETKKDKTFPLVYRLIELTLILPVATASVERIFSAMSIIKTYLRNKLSDGWLNDLMVCYTEQEIFKSIDDAKITKRFQSMKDRRGHLPKERNVIT